MVREPADAVLVVTDRGGTIFLLSFLNSGNNDKGNSLTLRIYIWLINKLL